MDFIRTMLWLLNPNERRHFILLDTQWGLLGYVILGLSGDAQIRATAWPSESRELTQLFLGSGLICSRLSASTGFTFVARRAGKKLATMDANVSYATDAQRSNFYKITTQTYSSATGVKYFNFTGVHTSVAFVFAQDAGDSSTVLGGIDKILYRS